MPLDIGRDRVQQLATQGAAIVEVLPAEEYKNEHLAGAISLPLDDFKLDAIERTLGKDRARHIVVYCQSSD